MLEGSVFIMTGDTVTEEKQEGGIYVPKVWCIHSGIADLFLQRQLIFYVPGGHEDYLKDLGEFILIIGTGPNQTILRG